MPTLHDCGNVLNKYFLPGHFPSNSSTHQTLLLCALMNQVTSGSSNQMGDHCGQSIKAIRGEDLPRKVSRRLWSWAICSGESGGLCL